MLVPKLIVGIAAAVALALGATARATEFRDIQPRQPKPGDDAKVYTLAVLPLYSPREVLRQFGPLTRTLSAKTGLRIQLVVPSDFDNHIAKVRSGQVDFSYQNPVVHALCMDRANVLATAVMGGEDKFRGIIIARGDAGIDSVDAIVGKRISIVSRTSAGGYYSQVMTCLMHGIDIDKQCQVASATANKQENVILDVYEKRADVGFIRESALHMLDAQIDPAQLKVVAQTEALPHWAFAANKDLPEQIVARVQELLLSLTAEAPEMKAAKLDAFLKGENTLYEGLRHLVAEPR